MCVVTLGHDLLMAYGERDRPASPQALLTPIFLRLLPLLMSLSIIASTITQEQEVPATGVMQQMNGSVAIG